MRASIQQICILVFDNAGVVTAHVTGHHLVAESQQESAYSHVLIRSPGFIQTLLMRSILNLHAEDPSVITDQHFVCWRDS